MPGLSFKTILTTSDANVKLAKVKQEAESTQSVRAEKKDTKNPFDKKTGLRIMNICSLGNAKY